MIVYYVYDYDFDGDTGRYFRNKKKAKDEFSHVLNGYLERITITGKINKDMIINLLNHENFVSKFETLETKEKK